MLKRKMYDKLVEWKNASARKALILLGARQTGKTYIVKQFGRENYDNLIYVNFLEDEESGRFLASASSAQELVSRLSLINGRGIQPGTLVFFDEVQHLGHDIVTLSKYLIEDGRFDLVLSGSLLSTALSGATSFPVGYARILRMLPLDFEEFCWATGVSDDIIGRIRENYREKRPFDEPLHNALVQIFRQYIAVGGMPEAVQSFAEQNRDMGAARAIDSEIVEQYRYDIVKYAKGKEARILTIFNNVPGQLAKENKRFGLSSVNRDAKFERLQDDFSWLEQVGVVLPAYCVAEPAPPLLRTLRPNRFKLYASDCGMLLTQYPRKSTMDIIDGIGDSNFGAVYENVVAQELVSAGFPLTYYNNNRKGEVDFLVEAADGKVLPVEVKSGKDYKRHAALGNLLRTANYGIERAYVFSEHNLSVGEIEGKPVYYLPLYMTLCLGEEQELPGVDWHLPPPSFSDLEMSGEAPES